MNEQFNSTSTFNSTLKTIIEDEMLGSNLTKILEFENDKKERFVNSDDQSKHGLINAALVKDQQDAAEVLGLDLNKSIASLRKDNENFRNTCNALRTYKNFVKSECGLLADLDNTILLQTAPMRDENGFLQVTAPVVDSSSSDIESASSSDIELEFDDDAEENFSPSSTTELETKSSANISVRIASASVIAGVATGLGLGFSSLGLSFFGSTTAVQIGTLTLGASALTSGIIGLAVALGVGLIGAGIYYAVKASKTNTYPADQGGNHGVLTSSFTADSNGLAEGRSPSLQSLSPIDSDDDAIDSDDDNRNMFS